MSIANHHEDHDSPVATMPAPAPARPKIDRLPPWNVLLHNDDVNEVPFVVDSIVMITPLNRQDAIDRTLEAHVKGLALLTQTHREHAELIQERFTSRGLTVTIERGK